ncbi:MAG: glycoside hydrolase family 3 C-terminal domain-containing protein [Propionibacteriaceae bacterium]|nr:glycoside hydrolase family 3 C-terminal domain-containing protein [Propionibacteriaceae bacterium]
MTRDEKIQQFRAERQYQSGIAPRIARLGVEPYNYWNEAMHGVAHAGRTTGANITTFNMGGWATEFPSPIAMAASWDRDLIEAAGDIVSTEGRIMSNYNNTNSEGYAPHKGLTYWTPTINMARDPRWGRTEETWGEDPYLTGNMAGAYADGLQGHDATYLKVAATPKHYFANNSENDRRWASEEVSEREIREYYTWAFADLAANHQTRSLMTAYNAVNGVPMSASEYSLETLARRTWGFTGTVVSDCGAVGDVYASNKHAFAPAELGHAASNAEAVAYTLKAGTDLACSGGEYALSAGFPTSISNGYITDEDMDVALTRAFTLRMETGEFDPIETVPYRSAAEYNTATNETEWKSYLETHKDEAENVSDQSVVLLKNDTRQGSTNKMLPIKAANSSKIVILGPQAQISVHGNYSPTRRIFETPPVTAITNAAKAINPAADVKFYPGISGDPKIGSSTRGDWARTKPAIGGTVGGSSTAIRFLDASDTELGRVTVPEIVQQRDFIGWTAGTNNPTTITSNNSWEGWLGFTKEIPVGTTQIELRMTGAAGTNYLTDGYFDLRVDSPTGGIMSTIPGIGISSSNAYQRAAYNGPTGVEQHLYFVYRSEFYHTTLNEDIDSDNPGNTWANEVASADAVIVYVGTLCSNNQTQPVLANNPADGREDEDRASYELARAQGELAAEAAALNPNTVVYMATTNAVDVTSFVDQAKALVWTAYNGQSQSEVAGRILFGQANPTGKLPVTWYKNLDGYQNIFDYSLAPVDGKLGRTYQYYTGDVTFPFGYGLSYSTYQYSNLQLDTSSLNVNGTLTASVDVKNTSTVDGKETVELYVSSPLAADPMYPDIQLKGFEKVPIAAGQTVNVAIELKGEDLWFWDDVAMKEYYPLGTWNILVGPSSDAAAGLTSTFQLHGTLTPRVETVATVPDGVLLNLQTPGNAIHANLSATRNDQSFYDLDEVQVSYTSSNPAVAAVSGSGAVTPVGVGTAEITATVTADGTSGSSSFPVIVRNGPLVTEYNSATTTIDGIDVNFPDQWADSALALGAPAGSGAGVALQAEVVPADPSATYVYSIAMAEENSAGASIDGAGKLHATGEGIVRVTVVATSGSTKVSHTATVRVGDAPIDTAALAKRIDNIENAIDSDLLVEENYTADSWEDLQDALAAGEAALSATDQAVVDQALADINAAYANLVPRGDTAPLAALVDAVDGLADAAATYTPASWADLEDAIDDAKALIAHPENVTQPVVDAALDAITDALAALEIAVVKASLISLIDSVDAQIAGNSLVPGNYTSSSWSALTSALTAAKAARDSATATQADVDTAQGNLQTAVAGLTTLTATDQLASLVDTITAMGMAETDYTAASWNNYQAALAAAQALIATPTSQTAIDAARDQLAQAIAALVLDPNRNAPAELAAMVNAVDKLKATQATYTAASWAALETALAQARSAVSTGTNADAAQALTRLENAVAGLQARASTQGLLSTIGSAEGIDTSIYSPESVAALASALTVARALLDVNPDSLTATQINNAIQTVNQAVAGLTPKEAAPVEPDKTALAGSLSTLIKNTEAITPSKYTELSYAKVAAELATAKTVLANPSATPAQYQAAITAVANAILALQAAEVVTPTPTPTDDSDTKTAPVTVTTKSVTVTGKAFKKKTKPKVTVTITLSSGTAVGKVTLYVAGKKVKSFNAIKAKTTVTLPKKYAKAIKVKAKYTPKSAAYGKAKTSATKTIKVKK